MSEQINLAQMAKNCRNFSQFCETANYALENPERYLKNEKENVKAKEKLFRLMKEVPGNV